MNSQGDDDVGDQQLTDVPFHLSDTSASSIIFRQSNLEQDPLPSCENSEIGSNLKVIASNKADINGKVEKLYDDVPLLFDIAFDNPSLEESTREDKSAEHSSRLGNRVRPLLVDLEMEPKNDLALQKEEIISPRKNSGCSVGPDISKCDNGEEGEIIVDVTFMPCENGHSNSVDQPPALSVYFSRVDDELEAFARDELLDQLRSATADKEDLAKRLQTAETDKEIMSQSLKTADKEKGTLAQRISTLEAELSEMGLKLNETEKGKEAAEQARAADLDAAATARAQLDCQISEMRRTLDRVMREKESMVVRYAKSEREVMDCRKDADAANKRCLEITKERDTLADKAGHLAVDKNRLSTALDNKNMELSVCHREVDKLKEELNSRDIKVKWVQNKLKSEMDAHKESASTVDRLNEKIAELQKIIAIKNEEIETWKKNVEDYETFKTLDVQLKEEQAKIILERHEHSERESKLKSLQSKNDLLIEENNNLSFQVQNLEVERVSLEEKLSIARTEAQDCGNAAADLKARLVEFDSLSNQLMQEREKVEKLVDEVERLRKTNEELLNDMAACRNREAEMLSFTQKLTTKNVQLQSEFSALETKVSETSRAEERAEEAAGRWAEEAADARASLAAEKERRESDNRLLARKVAEASSRCDSLEAQLAEARSEAAGQKNKHQAGLKELQRELQHCWKKLEQYESEGKHSSDGTTDRKLHSTEKGSKSVTLPESLQKDLSAGQLVERILRLQSELGKQQEKIEFLEDHNASLVAQLQRRGRLLHAYVLREQAGALSSAASDAHKVEMSRHGGIMASLYGSKSTDDTMTLELSLEINHKLQAVLEDTLLKNITLKENIDTLGDEIARLKKQMQVTEK